MAQCAKSNRFFAMFYALCSMLYAPCPLLYAVRAVRPDKRLLAISFVVVMAFLVVGNTYAEETLSLSGRLNMSAVDDLDKDSVKEDPTVEGRIKLDATGENWRFHSWLEGGFDGSVIRPPEDRGLFKTYDRVYQSNTPYLEFKDLSVTRSSGDMEIKAGIQRFAWGRLDEYPPNDLLNPWDYTRFLTKSLEDRKIGVPSVSLNLTKGDWTYETVWVPIMVPYRLALPEERWSGISFGPLLSGVPNAEVIPTEPDLPARTLENGNFGFRVKRGGDIEWALNLFAGYDPNPVFKTTALVIDLQPGRTAIDPGYTPDFHKIVSIGLDAATVLGDWSLRAEGACIAGRFFNIRQELWGYPSAPVPGVNPLNDIEVRSNALDYGIGADYRLIEDVMMTVQAQQSVILDRPDTLYDRKIETILWASIKAGWMNQKVETNATVAWNPEHGDRMTKAVVSYIFTDAWKASITGIDLNGPDQSVFGRYSMNDQVGGEVVYSW